MFIGRRQGGRDVKLDMLSGRYRAAYLGEGIWVRPKVTPQTGYQAVRESLKVARRAKLLNQIPGNKCCAKAASNRAQQMFPVANAF